MQSFEAAKSKIISSALGIALGLTANTPLADVATKIASIVNRGTLNWSGSNTTYSVPAGYYPGGTLDSRPSYTNGYNAGVTAADNRANANSANYKAGYNAGYSAGVTAGKATNKKVTGSFTSGNSGTTSTINTGLTKIDAFIMCVNDGTNGFAYWCSNFGVKGVRGTNFDCNLSISGGTVTYTATNSNWANRPWSYVAIGTVD